MNYHFQLTETMVCNLRLQCTLVYYLFTSRLGMKAYDYCGSPFMAVRAAQKFYPQFSNTQLSCTDGSKLHLGNQLLLYKKRTKQQNFNTQSNLHQWTQKNIHLE